MNAPAARPRRSMEEAIMAPAPRDDSTTPIHQGTFVQRASIDPFVGVLADYCDALARTTESPLRFIWTSALVCLASLLGREFRLRWGPKWLYPNLLVCLIGKTSKGRKTTAISDGLDVIVEPLRPRARLGEPEPFEVVRGGGSGEGLAEGLADRKYKDAVDGKTVERVQQGRRALYVVDELGALLEKVAREQAGSLVEFLLRLFDAPESWTHRTRTASFTITGGIGSLLAASTVDFLVPNLRDVHVMSGLPNRFFWVEGERGAPLPLRPPVENLGQLTEKFRQAISAVSGREASINPDAQAFHADLYCRRYSDGDGRSPLAEAATARGDVLALKIAMLLAAAQARTVITLDDIRTAWGLVESSEEVVEGIVDRLHEKDLREAERRVMDAAAKCAAESVDGYFTRRAAFQRVKGRSGMPAAVYNRIWESLAAADEFVVEREDGEPTGRYRLAGGGGGMPPGVVGDAGDRGGGAREIQ
jgi:hypothetical protein